MAKFSQTGVELGCSELGVIVPVGGKYLQPFGQTPNDALQRHRAAQDGLDINEPTRIMIAGNRFEAATREWFCHDFDTEVSLPNTGLQSRNCNLVASLDGRLSFDLKIVDFKGVEHDCPAGTPIDFKMPTYTPEDPESMTYHLQGQGHMECSGADKVIFAYLDRCRCNWTIVVFERHMGMIQSIRQAVDVFWEHMANDTNYAPLTVAEANVHILGNRKPEPLDLTHDASAAQFIDDDDRLELIELADDLVSANSAIKFSKEIKENVTLRIQEILGGTERVLLPGAKINWTTTETAAKPEVTKTIPAQPAKTSRRFTIKQEATK